MRIGHEQFLELVKYDHFGPENANWPAGSVKITKNGVTFLSSFPQLRDGLNRYSHKFFVKWAVSLNWQHTCLWSSIGQTA
jgi:hypothetical protein